MSLEIKVGYNEKDEIKKLFSEYTNMLIENEPGMAKYLKLQDYDYELSHLENKYGMPEGRLYIAYVKKVIPFNKADIHLKIHLVNSALDYDWIWNGDTDYFIGCYIPKYDNHLVWFARTKYGLVWIFNLIGREDC